MNNKIHTPAKARKISADYGSRKDICLCLCYFLMNTKGFFSYYFN